MEGLIDYVKRQASLNQCTDDGEGEFSLRATVHRRGLWHLWRWGMLRRLANGV